MANNKTDSKKRTGRGLLWILFGSGLILVSYVAVTLNVSIYALNIITDQVERPNSTIARLLEKQIISELLAHQVPISEQAKQTYLETQSQEPDDIVLLFTEFLHPINGYFTDNVLFFAQNSFPLAEDYQQQVLTEISKTSKRSIKFEDSENRIYLMLHNNGDTIRFDGTFIEYSIYKANLPKIVDAIIDNSIFMRYFEPESSPIHETVPQLSRNFYLSITDGDKLLYERGSREEDGIQEYTSRSLLYLDSLRLTIYGKFNFESAIVGKLKLFNILFVSGLALIVIAVVFLVRKREK